jgi:hypothetical protein
MEIYSRWDSKKVIYKSKQETIKLTISEAVKSGADLCGANLRGADLCGADLRDADLCGANLCGANLCGADLRGADLRGADLRDADLCGADLCGADLCGADLRGADLRGADLKNVKNYSENNYFGIELCKRIHQKFTLKEKAFVFEFIATLPCWMEIKEKYGKTALSVFKKLKDAGWDEYYNKYKEMI